jgi:predicted esterase
MLNPMRSFLLVFILGLMMVKAQDYYHTLKLENTRLEYALLLPTDFNPDSTYPTLLALPPGGQTKDMVEAGFGYWRDGAERGWVIISPVAPQGQLFYEDSASYLPKLLDEISKSIKFENNKVHLSGISNGGLSAFQLALDYPELFHSLLVAPGFPPNEDDFKNLDKINSIPIVMYVGEQDTSWVTQMQRTEQALKALGAKVTLTLVPNSGHIISDLNSKILFDSLDGFR